MVILTVLLRKRIRYIAELLLEAGAEVVLTRYRICDEVMRVALQEDVDVVGMGFYSAGYEYDIPMVLKGIKESGKDIKLIIGGIIPSDEIPRLKEMGVSGVFGPGSPVEEVLKCIAS